ncbi:MAG TPA: adenylate cyclase [Lachnospiraceae bacterium]|nr:adenylate cyclase [Lachnospiraceae bacterium]
MEIEKKYLATSIPFSLDCLKSKKISQCYISVDPTIRIRQSDQEYILTVKGSGLICREEFELFLTHEQYKKLLLKAETPILYKTRYFVPIENSLTAEIDIYQGNLQGLITIEVEFQSVYASETFTPPLWFGKDVSNSFEYTNSNLCLHGIPK